MTRIVPPARREQIKALVAEKRSVHPELRWPLTMQALRRMLSREAIALTIEPFPLDGRIVPLLGSWTLVIDESQPFDARPMIAAHELAHLWLHHDPFFERSETAVYDRSPDWYDELREAEADYAAERMMAGPEEYELAVRDTNRADLPSAGKKSKRITRQREPASNRHAASNIPLGTRKPEPPPPLPGWLEEVDRDADAVRLKETAIAAAREDAQRAPKPSAEPTVRFPIPRDQWTAIQLLPLSATGAPFPHYSNIYTAPHHEYVTATITAARGIVEQLARAGFKRTAVHVRRVVREAESR